MMLFGRAYCGSSAPVFSQVEDEEELEFEDPFSDEEEEEEIIEEGEDMEMCDGEEEEDEEEEAMAANRQFQVNEHDLKCMNKCDHSHER